MKKFYNNLDKVSKEFSHTKIKMGHFICDIPLICEATELTHSNLTKFTRLVKKAMSPLDPPHVCI